jgi:hypothetical protein
MNVIGAIFGTCPLNLGLHQVKSVKGALPAMAILRILIEVAAKPTGELILYLMKNK